MLLGKRKSPPVLFAININDDVEETQSAKYNINYKVISLARAIRMPRASIPFTIETSSLVTCPSPHSSLYGEKFKSLPGAKGSSCLPGGIFCEPEVSNGRGMSWTRGRTRRIPINSQTT